MIDVIPSVYPIKGQSRNLLWGANPAFTAGDRPSVRPVKDGDLLQRLLLSETRVFSRNVRVTI